MKHTRHKNEGNDHLTKDKRELQQRPWRRQRERKKKSSRLNNRNNNSARALHFLVHVFAVTARLRCEISWWDVLWRT